MLLLFQCDHMFTKHHSAVAKVAAAAVPAAAISSTIYISHTRARTHNLYVLYVIILAQKHIVAGSVSSFINLTITRNGLHIIICCIRESVAPDVCR